jgi:hypothetical protein
MKREIINNFIKVHVCMGKKNEKLWVIKVHFYSNLCL